MYLFDWYKKVLFDDFFNFRGRSSRTEYWCFTVLNIVIVFFAIVLMGIFASEGNEDVATGFLIVVLIYLLIIIIPSLALTIRRLHDIDKSGWNILLNCIPIVGTLCVLVFTLMNGTVGENRFGPDPKVFLNELDKIGQEQ